MFDNIRRDYVNHDRDLLHRGLWALVVYRFGVWTLRLRSRTLRWITSKIYGILVLFTFLTSGIRLDRHVTIGKDFRFGSVGPIYINLRVTFGDRCVVMHGVTVGGEKVGSETYAPTIGNDVIIGPRAVVLGRITVGDHARIAANSLVVGNVAPHSVVIGIPAMRVKNGRGCFQPVPLPEPETDNVS